MAPVTFIADRRPDRAVPVTAWARPSQVAYEDARDYLIFVADECADRGPVARVMVRAVVAYGRGAGGSGLERARAGTHLLAGHAAAACVAAHVRFAVPSDTELHGLVDAVAAQLWPRARPVPPSPESMRVGAELRRHCRKHAYGPDLHPALPHLATAAMSTELPIANRYAAALHRLTAATHRHHGAGADRTATAANALARVVAEARAGFDEPVSGGVAGVRQVQAKRADGVVHT